MSSMVVLLHLLPGILASAAGLAALFAPKGGRFHRMSGRVFTISMLVTAASGAFYAWAVHQELTIIAGIYTLYLVITAYSAVRFPAPMLYSWMALSLLCATGLSLATVSYGLDALHAPSGLRGGYAAEDYFLFGAMCTLGAVGDAYQLVFRAIRGKQRIARHLWRMGLALYIALGSLLDGPGTRIFPESLQGSWLLTAPTEAVGLIIVLAFAATLLRRHRPSTTIAEDIA